MKKLIQKWLGIDEINEVLTRNTGDYLGSEIDEKVEQKEFEDFKKELSKWKIDVIGYNPISFWSRSLIGRITTETEPTMIDRISAMEDYLGIEYKVEETKGYKKIKK